MRNPLPAFFPLAVLLASSVIASDTAQLSGRPTATAGTTHTGAWDVHWSDKGIFATSRTDGRTVAVCAAKREEWPASDESEGGYYQEFCDIVSVVGPFVSFMFSYDGSGGMHPIYGSRIRAVNLADGGKRADVADLVDGSELLKVLLNSPTIKSHLKLADVDSLDGLADALDGGCEMDFGGLRGAFAVADIKERTAVIRFGLGHGCEAMRGNFTQFEVEVPIPAERLAIFRAARAARTDANHLPHHPSR